MSKKAKRRHSKRQSTEQATGIRGLKPILRYGIAGFLLFLIVTALLTMITLKSTATPAYLHIAVYMVYGCSSLFCGVLCTARKRTPIFPNCFFAGFTELVLVLFCAVIASKAQVGIYVCIPIALSLVCPILGGIIGKKI